MKFVLSLLVLVSSFNVFAADMSAQVLLGMDRGAVNLGADVDFQQSEHHSLGGYFIIAPEKDRVRTGMWSVGADFKIYFGPDAFKLYLAPGVGITNFDLPTGDEMVLGTILKVGTLFEVGAGKYFGLEYMMFNNWSSDEVNPGNFQLANAVFRFDF